MPLPNRALVFEFETEVDRDQAVDVITPVLQDVQRKGKGVAVPQQSSAVMQGPQAELKQRLLEQDKCVFLGLAMRMCSPSQWLKLSIPLTGMACIAQGPSADV